MYGVAFCVDQLRRELERERRDLARRHAAACRLMAASAARKRGARGRPWAPLVTV